MTAPDLIGLFVGPLERTGIPYMITGGVASVIYGDPRFTRDLDVVLELHPPDVPSLVEAFQGEAYYLPPVEVMEAEAARSPAGHFNIIHRDTVLRAVIYVAGDDPLHAWAFERRQRIRFAELGMWVTPLEYVMLRKLQYYGDSQSDRHLRDIAMMLRISGDLVDTDAMEAWLARLRLHDDYAQVTDLHVLRVSTLGDSRSSRLDRPREPSYMNATLSRPASDRPDHRGPSAARWLACSSPGHRVR